MPKYMVAACWILSMSLIALGALLIDVHPMMSWWRGLLGLLLIAFGAALPGLMRMTVAQQAVENAEEETARLRHALRRARRFERLAKKGKQ